MKVILIGYPGSQKIVPASRYLVRKYLSRLDPIYLNHTTRVKYWTSYLRRFLRMIKDDAIIFALDDYLISGEADWGILESAVKEFKENKNLTNIKLCHCTKEEQDEYPVTTQYSLWRPRTLAAFMSRHKDPWDFEVNGSKDAIRYNWKTLHRPCIPYFTNSSLSGRWEGVNLSGLKEEDINYMKENGLL